MKKYLKHPVYILLGIWCIFSLFLFYYYSWSYHTPPVNQNVITHVPVKAKSWLPIHVSIPSIKVDATVVHLGLTASWEMDVPNNAHDVSWYNLGVKPWEIGSAVIAGHLDWKNGVKAVFSHLDELKKWDKIYIKNDAWKDLVFIVRESRMYNMDDDATEIFVSNSWTHLNFITCSGSWDTTRQKYTKRLVVFSDIMQ